MREIFKPRNGERLELGRVFYTITADDIGRRSIRTTECMIPVSDVIGYVQRQDIGKRLYRVRCNDPAGGWTWQCESARQRDERLTGTWSAPMKPDELGRFVCVMGCQHSPDITIGTNGVWVKQGHGGQVSSAHQDCYENWLSQQERTS